MAQLNSDDTKKLLTLLADALDEEMLLSLLAKNLYDNFELLFLKYNVLIYKRAYQMMRNREDAEDIVQETFIKALLAMLKYPDMIMSISLKGWLYTIARNIVINRKRKEKKGLVIDSIEGLVIDLDDYDESKQPEVAILAAERERYIFESVNKLPKEFRDLVKAYLYMQVRYSDLAKMTGKSVAITKSTLAEGIDLLRKIIKDVDDEVDTQQNVIQKLAS
ncbi:MAG: RNA polymerase sigma factor [Ktedonobacteraceae bacterium]